MESSWTRGLLVDLRVVDPKLTARGHSRGPLVECFVDRSWTARGALVDGCSVVVARLLERALANVLLHLRFVHVVHMCVHAPFLSMSCVVAAGHLCLAKCTSISRLFRGVLHVRATIAGVTPVPAMSLLVVHMNFLSYLRTIPLIDRLRLPQEW